MSAPFTITLDDKQVQDGLAKLARHISDLTPVMEDIGAKLGNLTEDAFQAEGPGWPQLSKARVKQRGNAHPILQDTGGLAASITHGGDRDSAWVGASKIYAAVHQFGNPQNRMYNTPRGNPAPIPARPFLPMTASGDLTPAAHDEVMDIITRALRAAIGQG